MRWDLSDLYAGPDDPRLAQDLDRALERAEELGARYRGRVGSLSAGELAKLLAEYERILEQSGRAGAFAFLFWSTNTEEEARGALLARLQEHSSQLQQRLLFLELEWAKVPEERARALLAEPALAARRAAEAFTAGLRGLLRVSTAIFNNLLSDKASEDRLRRSPPRSAGTTGRKPGAWCWKPTKASSPGWARSPRLSSSGAGSTHL